MHLGVRLAIDDFGTGYSSLTHLVDVPGQLREDRPVVRRRGWPARTRSTAIVEAVVSLCRALHIDVVAEGIEEEEQRRMLSRAGLLLRPGLPARPARPDRPHRARAGRRLTTRPTGGPRPDRVGHLCLTVPCPPPTSTGVITRARWPPPQDHARSPYGCVAGVP